MLLSFLLSVLRACPYCSGIAPSQTDTIRVLFQGHDHCGEEWTAKVSAQLGTWARAHFAVLEDLADTPEEEYIVSLCLGTMPRLSKSTSAASMAVRLQVNT